MAVVGMAAAKPDRQVAILAVTWQAILARTEVADTAAIGAGAADTVTAAAYIWVTHTTMTIMTAAIIATVGAFADTDFLMEFVWSPGPPRGRASLSRTGLRRKCSKIRDAICLSEIAGTDTPSYAAAPTAIPFVLAPRRPIGSFRP